MRVSARQNGTFKMAGPAYCKAHAMCLVILPGWDCVLFSPYSGLLETYEAIAMQKRNTCKVLSSKGVRYKKKMKKKRRLGPLYLKI